MTQPETDNPYIWWVARDGSHGSCYRADLIIVNADDIPLETKEHIDLAACGEDLERVWDLMSTQNAQLQEGTS